MLLNCCIWKWQQTTCLPPLAIKKLCISSWFFTPAYERWQSGPPSAFCWRCSVSLPQGTLSLVLNKERTSKDNSLFRQTEHVLKSLSSMFNKKIWNINIFANWWKQLSNTRIIDFSSEAIKCRMAWHETGAEDRPRLCLPHLACC